MSNRINETIIPNLIIDLNSVGILGLEEYENRLQNNANNDDNFHDLLFEADVALMFSHNGFKVTLRERPDIKLERFGKVVYAEVKHFRRKEQDILDEKAMQENDELVPVGILTPTEGIEAWDQIVRVAIRKNNQYVNNAPNLLVIATSSDAVGGLELQTAVTIYNEKARIDPKLHKLNAMILIDQWIDVARYKNVYFYPTAIPTIPMSEGWLKAIDDIQNWGLRWAIT